VKTVDIILEKIKREGAVTAKQLSQDLDMTSMGARQHLLSLEESGLVEFFDKKVKVGRPARHWSLTAQGHAQFADTHADLTVQVIDAVESLFGKEGVAKVSQEREAKTIARYAASLDELSDLGEKLQRLAALREADGYMAEMQTTDDGYLLIENHCPICRAAQHCPTLCQSELNVFSALLGDDVRIERCEHIIRDERRCVYRITPQATKINT
jgi:predicted ArsR family transcriptional regulator